MPKESLTAKRERVLSILDRLTQEFQGAKGALDFTSPFELLVATILSAQCTDERVNQVTRTLFRKYRTPQDYVDVPLEELEKDIHSTGFFHNKAVSLKKCAQALIDRHNGEVPGTMEELTALGGVGRKTANVVLGNAFGVPGIAVDTHVKRISGLLNLTGETNPDKIEADLSKLVPEADWTRLGHLLASLGRKTCVARRPKCEECVISDLCPSSSLS